MYLCVCVYVVAYQRDGIDAIESAYGVLQLLTRESTQEVTSRANAAHKHVDVHPGLQTQTNTT